MRRAGQVVRATQGLAVVRTPDADAGGSGGGSGGSTGRSGDAGGGATDHERRPDVPRIGTELVDESLDAVGEVVDVFGPVARPYLAVSPAGRDPATMLGEKLYEQ